MPEDITAIKREKMQMDVNKGMIQTRGEELVNKKSGKDNSMGKGMLKSEICNSSMGKKSNYK